MRAADFVPPTSSPTISIPTADLSRHAQDWLLNCDYRQHSPRTIETRRVVTDKLLWFLLHHIRFSLSRRSQVAAILQAAKRSNYPRRDEAIILFLLDTGLRASELCSLKMSDVDLPGRSCRVLGKGNKYRSLSFSREAGKVLGQYLQREARQPDDALFRASRGTEAGGGLSRSGLFQMVQRLGKEAGIQATRCSPRTCRHTCAVEFLRAGGGVFVLKVMLGHTSLAVTNRYCAVAQADVQSQHQKFSPVERLRRREK